MKDRLHYQQNESFLLISLVYRIYAHATKRILCKSNVLNNLLMPETRLAQNAKGLVNQFVPFLCGTEIIVKF